MLISIIIPAYNVSPYIEACIHSAFSQTYPHIEGTLTAHKPSKMLIVPDSVWPERKINQPYPYNEYYCSSLNYLLF